ncbi:MAG: hypothetical protein UY63_C0012G0020, partial [Parcubacteria group bacterium GW2011_GWA2_51_10]
FALATAAAFMRGGEPGITFALENELNLTIDSRAFYNGLPVPGSTWALKDLAPGVDKFFNFDNILPKDSGKTTISMHLESRDSSWLCLNFTNLQSNDNGVNEPESSVDPNGNASGELAEAVEFFAWRDDGDDVFEVGELPFFGTTTQSASVVLNETTYAIADFSTGTALPSGTTRHVGMAWCAGDLSVNLATAQILCDGVSLGNAAQTDSFSVDVSVQAESSRDKPTFTCAEGDGDGTQRPREERGERGERDERPERPERPEPPEPGPENNSI